MKKLEEKFSEIENDVKDISIGNKNKLLINLYAIRFRKL
jgi:hypothetical protein